MKRLTYANAVSTIALVIALGLGSAYAANQIGSSDIKDNAIRSNHIKNGQVKDADVKSCPGDTRDFAGSCWEKAFRTPAVNWLAALTDCGSDGGLLPDAAALVEFSLEPNIDLAVGEWTAETSSDPTTPTNLDALKVAEDAVINYAALDELHSYRCVMPRLG
jgi:hypothetical protein